MLHTMSIGRISRDVIIAAFSGVYHDVAVIQRLFSRLLISLLAATTACAAEQTYTGNNPPYTPEQQVDELLVKFKPHVDQQQARMIAESYGAREILPLSTPKLPSVNSPMAQWYRLKFDRNADLHQIMQRIVQDSGVEIVEMNAVLTIQKQ